MDRAPVILKNQTWNMQTLQDGFFYLDLESESSSYPFVFFSMADCNKWLLKYIKDYNPTIRVSDYDFTNLNLDTDPAFIKISIRIQRIQKR